MIMKMYAGPLPLSPVTADISFSSTQNTLPTASSSVFTLASSSGPACGRPARPTAHAEASATAEYELQGM